MWKVTPLDTRLVWGAPTLVKAKGIAAKNKQVNGHRTNFQGNNLVGYALH